MADILSASTSLYNIIKDMKHGKIIYPNPNYMMIPVTLLEPNKENAELFNKILKLLEEADFHLLQRTPSGGIAKGINKLILPAYDYTYTLTNAEITILYSKGAWRIQFRSPIFEDSDTGKKISGKKAFIMFKKYCADYNINLDDYAVDNGLDIKGEIESPLICMANAGQKDRIWNNVNHVDFHNSYPAGLVNTHPEFHDVIKMCYDKRKEKDKMYKAVLNLSIGFMQSKWCGYKYATLSRDAINDNNKRIKELAQRLTDAGNIILAYNTDGIWYKGDVYHGEGEGKDLGQWENDHVNCTFRMKSDGAYEFIEDGKYHPVVRGYTRLDRIKDRSNWEWGDIYQAEIETYSITEEGIIYKEVSEWEEK